MVAAIKALTKTITIKVNQITKNQILVNQITENQTLVNQITKNQIQQGNEKSCHEVEKFVKEVNELVDEEELDAAKALPLLDEANSLLAECPTDDDDD